MWFNLHKTLRSRWDKQQYHFTGEETVSGPVYGEAGNSTQVFWLWVSVPSTMCVVLKTSYASGLPRKLFLKYASSAMPAPCPTHSGFWFSNRGGWGEERGREVGVQVSGFFKALRGPDVGSGLEPCGTQADKGGTRRGAITLHSKIWSLSSRSRVLPLNAGWNRSCSIQGIW